MEFPIISTRYDHVNTFVNTIAPVVCNEWLKRKDLGQKRISPAVVIAQAGKESGWNLDAKTLFGIKGSDLELDTTEYINGEYVDCTLGFKAFPDVAGAVVGYFDLMQWDNYDDATSAITVESELEGLTNNIGIPYATAKDYYETTLDIINDFNLRVFNDYVDGNYTETEAPDKSETEELTEARVDTYNLEDVARAVIRGEYGNGTERILNLTNLGYDYGSVQEIVDRMLNETPSFDTNLDEIANAVIRGEYGNMPERKDNLENAGYDYNIVQAIVDEKLSE